MRIEKGYKYRIQPNKTQQEQLETMFSAKRLVWNHFLKLNMDRYEKKEHLLTYNKMSKLLTELKGNQPWLYQCEKSILQNTLKDLASAYSRFNKGPKKYSKKTLEKAARAGKTLTFYDLEGHPKFKSYRDLVQSCKMSWTGNNIEVKEKEVQYTLSGKYRKQNCKIKLPKVKDVKIAYSRPYQGRLVSASVTKESDGKYYVSLCCIEIEHEPTAATGSNVGIDMGLKAFYYTSDKEVAESPKYYRKYEKRMIKEQRKLSRRQKGGKNRNRQRVKVSRWHKRVRNCRKDFIHRLSTSLINRYDQIYIEDLNVKGMIKNRRLAKSVADAGFSEFFRQLEYKGKWNYKLVRKVDRFYASSQICSECGHQSGQTKDLSVRLYQCKECGLEIDRDFNAAINILKEGLRTAS